jgi:hypothetical protein
MYNFLSAKCIPVLSFLESLSPPDSDTMELCYIQCVYILYIIRNIKLVIALRVCSVYKGNIVCSTFNRWHHSIFSCYPDTQNGGGSIEFRPTQINFEVVLEIRECA